MRYRKKLELVTLLTTVFLLGLETIWIGLWLGEFLFGRRGAVGPNELFLRPALQVSLLLLLTLVIVIRFILGGMLRRAKSVKGKGPLSYSSIDNAPEPQHFNKAVAVGWLINVPLLMMILFAGWLIRPMTRLSTLSPSGKQEAMLVCAPSIRRETRIYYLAIGRPQSWWIARREQVGAISDEFLPVGLKWAPDAKAVALMVRTGYQRKEAPSPYCLFDLEREKLFERVAASKRWLPCDMLQYLDPANRERLQAKYHLPP